MDYASYHTVVTNENGAIVPMAKITVRNSDTGQLARLYSERDGSQLKSNPFQTDQWGEVFFFVKGGAYTVTAEFGSLTRSWTFVAIGTAAEYDIDELAQYLNSGVKYFKTHAELSGYAPLDFPAAAVVLNDPDATKTGYYTNSGAGWVYARALEDTIAQLLINGGGVNDPSAVLGAGINPSSPLMFYVDVITPNTGSVTLTVSGLGQGVVLNAAGNPLAAGEWQGRIMLTREADGRYKLMNDPASALSAAQSATEAGDARDAAVTAKNQAESAKAAAEGSATAAATSATNSGNSATAAASSATAAGNSATAAAGSASTASTKAGEAASSATAAAGSAATANTKAGDAAASATAAAGSASTATTQAGTATTQANRAKDEADRAAAAAGGAVNAVTYISQSLTTAQKTQARANIASVGYEAQTLTDAQKSQARANIDAETSYDTKAAAEAASIPSSVNAIRLNGYYTVGDGGGAMYKRVATEPSHAGKIQSADGAWWEIAEDELSVLQFGAVADSTGVGVGTDNSAMFNSAMLAAISLRRNIHIPAGGYRLSSPLVYDKTALNGDSGYVPNIRGDGVSMTRLFCSDSGIIVTGSTTAGVYGSFFNISDLYLRGNGTDGTGVDIVACGFVGLNNVRSTQFYTGCRLKGVISSKLDKPFFDNNVSDGLQALPDDGDVMPPNAITVDQPWIGSNGRCGIQLNQPATFNIRGGSVEGNGTNTGFSEGSRGGIIITNAGTGGHNAITSEGVYYEHNMGIADVLISGSNRIFSANFNGNTFTRLGATPVKHSIFATGATHNVTINLNGNGFGELGGGFVPTSAQRYIQIDGGANIYTLVDIGNQYMTAAARPIYNACRVISNNTMPYAMGYCTEAGAIEGTAFNVQSITKTGTGVYKINFGESLTGRKFVLCNFGFSTSYVTSTYDDSSITVVVTDLAGTPVDRAFGFVVYSTAWW